MSARDVIAEIKIGAKLKVGMAPVEVSVPLGTFNSEIILSALRSAGYAVVPVEPTLEMIAAWDRVARPGLHAFEARYKAMITAAQEDSRE